MNESMQKWFDELVASPSETVHKLVLGYSGILAWSRCSLRETFVEVFQTHADALDAAIEGWLQERLMELPPAKTSTVVWASHLQDLFSAIAGLPLPRVAQLMRSRLRDFRAWLRPLRTDESVDPEAAYLTALAWAPTNQRLEGMWQGLALRRKGIPPYYTDIGLLGLRKMRDEGEQLPSKAPFLLLATLIDLADTGISQKEWLLTTRSVLSGYHYSADTWRREFDSVLATRGSAVNGPEWLKKVLPQSGQQQHRGNRDGRHVTYNSAPSTFTLSDCNRIVADVGSHGPAALGGRLDRFLNLQRSFATESGNPYFLVRTFNRLAEVAAQYDPDWAIGRAEEALNWENDNPRNWTVLARSMWARGRHHESRRDGAAAEGDYRAAMDVLWEAQLRFPENAFVRNELAKMLRASGDLDTAEAIYRQTIAEIRDDVYCFTGLADLLLQRDHHSSDANRREEARQLFLEAVARGNRYARTRLEHLSERDGQALPQVDLRAVSIDEMRPAQRLGRALLLLSQGRRKSSHEREALLAEVDALLSLRDELTGECFDAFIEARGFALLARDQVAEARLYFAHQLKRFERPSFGLRFGLAESRARLGETLGVTEQAELAAFGPEGSILALVIRVVQLLASNGSDDAVREALLELYPRVRELAKGGDKALEKGRASELNESADRSESAAAMIAHLLIANVFKTAAIDDPDDLESASSVHRVRLSFDAHRGDIFSVAEKLAIAA